MKGVLNIRVHVAQQTLNHEHRDVDVFEHSFQDIERFVADGPSLKALGHQASCLLTARGHCYWLNLGTDEIKCNCCHILR